MSARCDVDGLKGQDGVVLKGTNQETSGPYNRRIVLESIRLHGPTTRRDIARRVGLTVQTVSTIVRELEEQGFILSLREEPRGKGVPPAALRVNPDGGMAVGIHITPLGIDAAWSISTATSSRRRRGRLPTPRQNRPSTSSPASCRS